MTQKNAQSTIDLAPQARQTQIFYDRFSYSAFPHVIHLEGDELLLAFRQAPREKAVRHTHPRSLITLVRSYDLGASWDLDNAGQMAAGGGQELGLIYLGDGKVGGALAAHEVVPVHEAERSGISHQHAHEYPFRNVGALWCWSDNYGLTWRVDDTVLVGDRLQACAPPVRLSDGTLLIPSYGAGGRAAFSSAVLHRSADGGATWPETVIMAKGSAKTRHYHEPAVVELEPGHLLGMLRYAAGPAGGRQYQPGIFWRHESTDNGLSWSRPRPTAVQSGACPRLLKLRDGRLLLTYGRRFEPYGIYASLSEDGGKSWGEKAWLVRPTPDGDQGYTSSLELEDGRIFTASYAKNARGVTGITGTFWRLP
jgi:sialidase-1